jgi:hypothetical protein
LSEAQWLAPWGGAPWCRLGGPGRGQLRSRRTPDHRPQGVVVVCSGPGPC